MAEYKEFVELIDHLIELTQEKQIKWTREYPPSSIITNNNRIKYVYTTEFNERQLRVFEEMYKYYTDEDQFHWQTRTIVEFIDGEDSIFEFPQTSNSWDLLKAIQYRDVDIDGLMKNILKKK